MRHEMRLLAAALVVAFAPLAVAAEAATQPDKGQALVAGKIASNFVTLAGSKDNSIALVNALRTGGPVTLVTSVPPPAGSPAGTPPTTKETTFDVPTKPMGWGNVKHSLALAQDQLARAGISNPTAAQLQTALTGGDLVAKNADGTTRTTSVKGILTMRAGGMGWGNIAQEGGTKLGHVQKVDMSHKPAGITTAAGSTAPTVAGSAKSAGPTITTAAGASATQAPKVNAGAGVVTGTGASATHVVSASGVTTAHGNAGGNGKSQGNGSGNGNGKGKGG